MKEDNIFCMPARTGPNVLLEKAKGWGLKEVMVLGWDERGEFCVGGSNGSHRELSWLLRAAEHWLLREMTNTEDG